jgi:L-lactate dehydrogenase complex protein LldG
MLARVRAALGDVPSAERAADVAVVRDYRQAGSIAGDELVERFVERAGEYRARVAAVAAADVRDAVERALDERGARTVVVPADLPAAWRPRSPFAIVEDRGLTAAELDAIDAVVTGCAVAIAETGTIVLDGGAGQGRRAITLVPDRYVCVVESERVVELVPEAIERSAEAARAGRPITLVSGPSATSDIELQRVEGVHGPRALDVLVVR